MRERKIGKKNTAESDQAINKSTIECWQLKSWAYAKNSEPADLNNKSVLIPLRYTYICLCMYKIIAAYKVNMCLLKQATGLGKKNTWL